MTDADVKEAAARAGQLESPSVQCSHEGTPWTVSFVEGTPTSVGITIASPSSAASALDAVDTKLSVILLTTLKPS